jgi:hypothetical protein
MKRVIMAASAVGLLFAASISGASAANHVVIEQLGRGNANAVGQNGELNKSRVYQNGQFNSGRSIQRGFRNYLNMHQTGSQPPATSWVTTIMASSARPARTTARRCRSPA